MPNQAQRLHAGGHSSTGHMPGVNHPIMFDGRKEMKSTTQRIIHPEYWGLHPKNK